ncbi:MAG: MraY family glycosyltransferase [Planctomycetaceae bacterium]
MHWTQAATFFGPMVFTVGLSFALTALACRIAPLVGLIDRPDGGRKAHSRATPVMGGVAFVTAILIGLAYTSNITEPGETGGFNSRSVFSLCASLICFCLLGVCDDRWPLSPRLKLLGQILASLPFVCLHATVDVIGIMGWEIPLGWLGGPITILWLVACANVVNLIDGLDGLAGSIGLVVFLTIAALFGLQDHFGDAKFTTVIAGGLVGFLVFNWPPAKIFMGDAGSMSIGFLAGALSIQASSKTATTFTLAVPVVLMSVPMFDTAMAILRRRLSGRSIGQGDRAHIHHCLQNHGLSRQQALLAIAGLTLIMAGAVLVSVLFEQEVYSLLVCAGVLGLLISARVFGYQETSLVFRHLQELGDVLFETSGVLQTRFFLARLENFDADQRARLWDQLVTRVASMGVYRLDYRCRSTEEANHSFQLNWENIAEPVLEDDDSHWQVVYQGRRADGQVAKLKATGKASPSGELPRVDDLLRLFAKVGLELPASAQEAALAQPVREHAATMPFLPTSIANPAKAA